jgi:hypothetical protein
MSNKTKNKERLKKFYENNKERLRKEQQEFRDNNKMQIKVYRDRHYNKHKDKLREKYYKRRLEEGHKIPEGFEFKILV